MMCKVCSPICGACRPPRRRAINCPECGWYNVCDLEDPQDSYRCTECGAEMVDEVFPQPVICGVVGEACYNPCGRSATIGGESPVPGECEYHVREPLSWLQDIPA